MVGDIICVGGLLIAGGLWIYLLINGLDDCVKKWIKK